MRNSSDLHTILNKNEELINGRSKITSCEVTFLNATIRTRGKKFVYLLNFSHVV